MFLFFSSIASINKVKCENVIFLINIDNINDTIFSGKGPFNSLPYLFYLFLPLLIDFFFNLKFSFPHHIFVSPLHFNNRHSKIVKCVLRFIIMDLCPFNSLFLLLGLIFPQRNSLIHGLSHDSIRDNNKLYFLHTIFQ